MEADGGRDVERRIALKRTRLFADLEAVLEDSAYSDGGDGSESDSHARTGQPELDPSKAVLTLFANYIEYQTLVNERLLDRQEELLRRLHAGLENKKQKKAAAEAAHKTEKPEQIDLARSNATARALAHWIPKQSVYLGPLAIAHGHHAYHHGVSHITGSERVLMLLRALSCCTPAKWEMPLVDPVVLQQTPMKQIERVTKKLKEKEDLEPAIGRALTRRDVLGSP